MTRTETEIIAATLKAENALAYRREQIVKAAAKDLASVYIEEANHYRNSARRYGSGAVVRTVLEHCDADAQQIKTIVAITVGRTLP